MSKHSGDLMLCKFIAENPGDILIICFAIFSAGISLRQRGIASIPASLLSNKQVPTTEGTTASDPILPNPWKAVPFETTATRFPIQVKSSRAETSA